MALVALIVVAVIRKSSYAEFKRFVRQEIRATFPRRRSGLCCLQRQIRSPYGRTPRLYFHQVNRREDFAPWRSYTEKQNVLCSL